jgi:hypothetical protein
MQDGTTTPAQPPIPDDRQVAVNLNALAMRVIDLERRIGVGTTTSPLDAERQYDRAWLDGWAAARVS